MSTILSNQQQTAPVLLYPDSDGDNLGDVIPCETLADCVRDSEFFTESFGEACISNSCVKYFCMEQNTDEIFVDTLYRLYDPTSYWVLNSDDNDPTCNLIDSTFTLTASFFFF